MRVLMPSPNRKAVGQHHGGAAAGLQQLHDQHQEQVGGFTGAEGGRKIRFYAVLFHAAEGRVGDDHFHALFRPPADQRARQRVVVADIAGHINAVQDHVGGAEQVRQRLLLDAEYAALQDRFIVDRFHILLPRYVQSNR
jgi:hypothetical protein